MICNLCFYGAVRTLDETSNSIQKYVIEPLSKQYTINIFAAVWEDDSEKYEKYEKFEKFGKLKIKKINRPKRFSKIKIEADENFRKIYPEKPDVIKNLYYALYSLKSVTSMIKESELTIFIRPDSKFYSEIPLNKIESSQIITPIWDNYYFHPEHYALKSKSSEEGANDRFIICSGNTAKIVGMRYDLIDEYLEKRKGNAIIHPEGFFEWTLKKNNIKNIKVDICFTLLRENGNEDGDCISKKDPFWNSPNKNKNRKTRKSKSFLN
jgi:hypothetical protein